MGGLGGKEGEEAVVGMYCMKEEHKNKSPETTLSRLLKF